MDGEVGHKVMGQAPDEDEDDATDPDEHGERGSVLAASITEGDDGDGTYHYQQELMENLVVVRDDQTG
jgi:hypothetical protein